MKKMAGPAVFGSAIVFFFSGLTASAALPGATRNRVVLIHYRPPTVAGSGAEPAATWKRFLDYIH